MPGPSVSHLHKLVARNWKIYKTALQKALESVKPHETRLQPSLARVSVTRQPLHPVAYIRQLKSRGYHTFVRSFTSASAPAAKPLRSSYPVSRTSRAVGQLATRAPFASTLRPSLTGGALPRSAGGYSIGGGARYFSHGPAGPAEVVNNVSQAIRAFYLAGNKAQYHGNNHRGEKRYRSVSTQQDAVHRQTLAVPKATPGSTLEFAVNPTLTALTPLQQVTGFSDETPQPSLAAEGLLNVLSADFSRALKDLAAVLADLKKLADFGDLRLSYDHTRGMLEVHFPGCDAQSVESLCDDIGVTRGVVTQDPDFDVYAGTEIALLFPFAESNAPSAVSDPDDDLFAQGVFAASKPTQIDWEAMMSERASVHDERGSDYDFVEDAPVGAVPKSSLGSPGDGYESMRHSDADESRSPLEYRDDLEGIYRFLALCDSDRRGIGALALP